VIQHQALLPTIITITITTTMESTEVAPDYSSDDPKWWSVSTPLGPVLILTSILTNEPAPPGTNGGFRRPLKHFADAAMSLAIDRDEERAFAAEAAALTWDLTEEQVAEAMRLGYEAARKGKEIDGFEQLGIDWNGIDEV
jgi:hypothetical protein